MRRRSGAVGLSLGLSVWVCLWVVVLSGCAATGPGATPPTDPLDPTALRSDLRTAATSRPATTKSGRATPPGAPVVPQPTVTGIAPSLTSFVDIARADLAKRLAVDPTTIEVTAAGSVTWTNSALGCPASGRSYIDEVIDGALVILRAGGKEYRYHAGGARGPFLCVR